MLLDIRQGGFAYSSSGKIAFPIKLTKLLGLSFYQIPSKNTGHSDWYLSTPYGLGTSGFTWFSYEFDGKISWVAFGV